jgi:hypothetical protein
LVNDFVELYQSDYNAVATRMCVALHRVRPCVYRSHSAVRLGGLVNRASARISSLRGGSMRASERACGGNGTPKL